MARGTLAPRLLVGVLLLLCSASLLALDINGIGAYKEFGSDIYFGALYLETPASSPEAIYGQGEPKGMEIRFVDRVSNRRWVNSWTQSIAINNNSQAIADVANELSAMLSAFAGGFKAGDIVSFDYLPGAGTTVTLNDTVLQEGQPEEVFDLFLSAWIGPVPPSTQFKNAVLGTEGSAVSRNRFLSIEPGDERIAAVRDLFKGEKEEPEGEPATRQTAQASKPEPAPESRPEPEPTPPPAKAEPATTAATATPGQAEPEPEPESSSKPVQATAARAEEEDGDDVDMSVDAILAQQNYTSKVVKAIYGALSYPGTAVRRGLEGSIRLNLELDRSGDLVSVTLSEESPHPLLNDEALEAATRAAPYPAFDAAIVDQTLAIQIPIAFRLTQ